MFFDIPAEYLQLVKQSFAALRLKCLPNLKYPAILIYSPDAFTLRTNKLRKILGKGIYFNITHVEPVPPSRPLGCPVSPAWAFVSKNFCTNRDSTGPFWE